MKSAKLAPLLLASLVLLLSACTPAAEGCPTPAPVSPSAQPTQAATAEPTAEPSPVSTPTPEPTSSSAPTPTPEPVATPTPEPTPTPQPTPSPAPDLPLATMRPWPNYETIGDSILGEFPADGYSYLPDPVDMPPEEVALHFIEMYLEDLMEPKEDCSFTITAYRNVSLWDGLFWDDSGYYWFSPQAEVAYVGNYAMSGESDGSEYFLLIGDGMHGDMGETDSGMGVLGIRQDEDGVWHCFLAV